MWFACTNVLRLCKCKAYYNKDITVVDLVNAFSVLWFSEFLLLVWKCIALTMKENKAKKHEVLFVVAVGDDHKLIS